MFRFVKSKNKPITLREHYERRNKILIKRRAGGFGDTLMMRMLFEDLSKIGLEITYTCPYDFIQLTKNHPFMNSIDLSSVNERNYGIIYDVTTVCRVYETKFIPCKKHRSDIWAEYCGINLQNHEMFLTPIPDILEKVKENLNFLNPLEKKIVILATTSTQDDFGIAKSLTEEQITNLVKDVKDLGFLPIVIHDKPQEVYTDLGVIQLRLPIQEWIAYVSLADLIVSVDTATFHMAGGLKKPLVGIFTFTDGKIYGKYYQFTLVQKHRDNGNWDCGPCFMCGICPKEQNSPRKPCLTELSSEEIKKGIVRCKF